METQEEYPLELSEHRQPNPSAAYFPDNSALIAQQEDTTPAIELFEHKLKNEVWDSNQRCWVQIGEPILNKTGVDYVIGFLQLNSNYNHMLTTHKEENVGKKILNVMRSFKYNMCVNRKQYGPPAISDMDSIFWTVKTMIESTFNRSINNGERNYNKTVQRVEQVYTQNELQKEKKKYLFW